MTGYEVDMVVVAPLLLLLTFPGNGASRAVVVEVRVVGTGIVVHSWRCGHRGGSQSGGGGGYEVGGGRKEGKGCRVGDLLGSELDICHVEGGSGGGDGGGGGVVDEALVASSDADDRERRGRGK